MLPNDKHSHRYLLGERFLWAVTLLSHVTTLKRVSSLKNGGVILLPV